jgi:hypothetical protein
MRVRRGPPPKRRKPAVRRLSESHAFTIIDVEE